MATTGDSDLSNNAAATFTTVTLPDLTITKTGPSRAAVHDIITHTIEISNTSPVDAFDILFVDTFLLDIGIVGISASAGLTCDQKRGSLECRALRLAPGKTVHVNVSFAIPFFGPGTFTDTATVSTLAPELSILNNTATATTTVADQLPVPTDDPPGDGPATTDPIPGPTFGILPGPGLDYTPGSFPFQFPGISIIANDS